MFTITIYDFAFTKLFLWDCFPNMSKNFQLQIDDCRFAINADVKIMNLKT